jgi:hypothetical protein
MKRNEQEGENSSDPNATTKNDKRKLPTMETMPVAVALSYHSAPVPKLTLDLPLYGGRVAAAAGLRRQSSLSSAHATSSATAAAAAAAAGQSPSPRSPRSPLEHSHGFPPPRTICGAMLTAVPGDSPRRQPCASGSDPSFNVFPLRPSRFHSVGFLHQSTIINTGRSFLGLDQGNALSEQHSSSAWSPASYVPWTRFQ